MIATGILSESYTVPDLVLGTTYIFTAEAQNSVGFSTPSDPVTIFHAMPPEQPIVPTTANSGQDVIITWTAPFDNGSVITNY